MANLRSRHRQKLLFLLFCLLFQEGVFFLPRDLYLCFLAFSLYPLQVGVFLLSDQLRVAFSVLPNNILGRRGFLGMRRSTIRQRQIPTLKIFAFPALVPAMVWAFFQKNLTKCTTKYPGYEHSE